MAAWRGVGLRVVEARAKWRAESHPMIGQASDREGMLRIDTSKALF